MVRKCIVNSEKVTYLISNLSCLSFFLLLIISSFQLSCHETKNEGVLVHFVKPNITMDIRSFCSKVYILYF